MVVVTTLDEAPEVTVYVTTSALVVTASWLGAAVLLRLAEEIPEGRPEGVPEGVAEGVPEGLTPMGVRVTTGLVEEAGKMLAEAETAAEEVLIAPAEELAGALEEATEEALGITLGATEDELTTALGAELEATGGTEEALGATLGATEGALGATEGALGTELGATASTEEVGATEGAAEGCTEGSTEGVSAGGADSSGAGATGVGTTRTVEVDSSTALTERTW